MSSYNTYEQRYSVYKDLDGVMVVCTAAAVQAPGAGLLRSSRVLLLWSDWRNFEAIAPILYAHVILSWPMTSC